MAEQLLAEAVAAAAAGGSMVCDVALDRYEEAWEKAVNNYWLMMLAAGLFGLGFGGMVPVRSVLLSRLFGIKKFSRVNGLLSFFLAPATFWVLITGYIADSTGSYVPAFQVWALAFTLAGIVTAIIRLPNREDAVA